MKRQQTREEQDKNNDQSLRDTNLQLKSKKPYFNGNGDKKPFFDKPGFQDKRFKPRELIKASFFILSRGRSPQFLFNALLMDMPVKTHVFSIEDTVYTVKNVTRNLTEIKPGAMRETSVYVLVSGAKRYIGEHDETVTN